MPKDLKANLMSNTIVNVIQKFMIFKKIERSKIQKILKADTDSKDKVYHNRTNPKIS